jgi:FkbM family methyltransferase
MSRIKNFFKKLSRKDPDFRRKLPSGLTVEVKCRAEQVIYDDIFVSGEYDLPIEKSLSAPSGTPFIIADIGANVGYFSLRLADFMFTRNPDTGFKIILVEGSPSNYKELKSRLESEPALNNKIKLLYGLAGELRGNAKIYEYDFHAINSIYAPNRLKGATVPYIDLNSVFFGDPEIALLKCDIEGAEKKFIENYGELLKKTKYAVFEFHSRNCSVEECIRLLEKTGFSEHKKLREEERGKTETHFFWK